MPRLYWNNGLAIFVYFNDHDPMHCHVDFRGIKAKVVFDGTKWQIRYHRHQSRRFTSKTTKAILKEVRSLHIVIDNFWRKHHDKT